MSDILVYSLMCILFVIGVVCFSGDVCDIILTGNYHIDSDVVNDVIGIRVNNDNDNNDDVIMDVDKYYENVSGNIE